MNKALQRMGEYVILMGKSLSIPDRWSMFFKQLIKEIYKLGVDSLCNYHLRFYRYGYRHPDIVEYQLSADS